MGKPNSKEEVSDDHSTNIQATEVDASSGLHIFEFHMPTAGLSFGTVLFICMIIALVIWLKKKCKCIRLHRRYHTRDLPFFYHPAGFQQPPPPIYRPTVRPLLQPIPAADRFREISPHPAAEVPPVPCHHERSRQDDVEPNRSADYAWEPLPR